MSQQIDDGGPAFPHGEIEGQERDADGYLICSRGMSLRDWFAGQALMGVLASQQEDGAFEYYGKDDGELHENWVPATAYRIADAMLAARKGGAE